MTVDNAESNIKEYIDNLLADRRNSLQNMATIFVSSTKSDLEEERDAIIYLIQELGLPVQSMENFPCIMDLLVKIQIELGRQSQNHTLKKNMTKQSSIRNLSSST